MALTTEELEPRLLLTLVFGTAADADFHPDHGDARGGNPGPPGGGGGGGGGEPSGPEIDVFAVALHEFGHSLGLQHSDPNDGIVAVMDPFYTGPVTGLEAQDIARIQALYPEAGPSSGGQPWVSTDITYSFTPDKARMDQGGRNALFSTMNKAFGSEGVWQQIFRDALDTWTAATEQDGLSTVLTFTEVADNRAAFNATGSSQGDADFGDIRIAAHGFDGSSGVLAHAYFPPPNGRTAAGDAHFDKAENWKDLRGALSSSSSTSNGPGGQGHLTLVVDVTIDNANDHAFGSSVAASAVTSFENQFPISNETFQPVQAAQTETDVIWQDTSAIESTDALESFLAEDDEQATKSDPLPAELAGLDLYFIDFVMDQVGL
jgi:hypothetical protein